VEIVSYIDPNILTTAFGLLGVIIGGSVTARTSYLVEERRVRREERKEQRKRLTELKRAARLVDEDIKWALAAVTITINEKRWPALLQDPVGLEIWEEYRSLLSTGTTLGDWRILQAAVREEWLLINSRNKAIEKGKLEVSEAHNLALSNARKQHFERAAPHLSLS
jgi:hypothetical protein